jgi:hypothetical protein
MGEASSLVRHSLSELGDADLLKLIERDAPAIFCLTIGARCRSGIVSAAWTYPCLAT